eukprot:CAMPEP_0172667766 /NCGR_PEP_ID=MMETSP1074-20121228/8640_1 /TAXON_ID=2916 /ORGANISM="Ceratium fusus, Strain PA161109" /LENGTH=128 /DNA_ID=CAMNT_0013484329 /DNA_START=28 /DNA_END=414 /DNA_ORIENTATION=-
MRAQSRGSGGNTLARVRPGWTGRAPLSSSGRLNNSRSSSTGRIPAASASGLLVCGSSFGVLGSICQMSRGVSFAVCVSVNGGACKPPKISLLVASLTQEAPPGSFAPSMSRKAVYNGMFKSLTSSARV